MHPIRSRTKARPARGIAVLALAAVLAVSAVAVPMALAHGSKTVVGEARPPSLHKTVLTNIKGLTLYSLSAERNGRFICTSRSCTATWFPLIVARGTTPKGPVKLGTVKRPEGRIQVTFKGLPLYTFEGDSAKGQTKGEGFKDVGTWHAVTP
jgi:predicted lipoprotein with Yx(FWY)xxD motif